MKTVILTIRLDKEPNQLLILASASSEKKCEIAREALFHQLRLDQFEALRRRIMPFAEARGLLTNEGIFSRVS